MIDIDLKGEIEQQLKDLGYRYVIGIDEVGRGPLAGEVVSAAVCIELEDPIEGIKDSKKLSEKRRLEMATTIKEESVALSISKASVELIDEINIKRATIVTMERALKNILKDLEEKDISDFVVLVDSERISGPVETISIDKGDDKCVSIGAASIIAKVYRDSLATKWHEEYPEYGFDRHKGYGTRDHRVAIVRYGPSPIHRKSFLKNLPKWRENPNIRGKLGEDIATEYLEEKDYIILDRNYDSPEGEIDIIALKGTTIAFVEVKLRTNSNYGYGHEHVSHRQKQRIRTAAINYRRDKDMLEYQPRFDIIEIYTDDNSRVYYEDAF